MTVTSLHGGITGERKPNEACINILERMLERARLGGMVATYSQIGAAECLSADLKDMAREK